MRVVHVWYILQMVWHGEKNGMLCGVSGIWKSCIGAAMLVGMKMHQGQRVLKSRCANESRRHRVMDVMGMKEDTQHRRCARKMKTWKEQDAACALCIEAEMGNSHGDTGTAERGAPDTAHAPSRQTLSKGSDASLSSHTDSIAERERIAGSQMHRSRSRRVCLQLDCAHPATWLLHRFTPAHES